MSLRPGVIALAHALKEALELPDDLTGQVMLNFNQGRLESMDERIHRRAATPKFRQGGTEISAPKFLGAAGA